METCYTIYDFLQGFLSAVPNLRPRPAGSQPPAQQGVCRQLCQPATFPSVGPQMTRNTGTVAGTPAPGCHLPGRAELVALCSVTSAAGMEGNRDWVAVTRRIHAADGGADGDLSPWHCRTDVLQAQKPRAPQLGAEPCRLSCRKVGHHWQPWGRGMDVSGCDPSPTPQLLGKSLGNEG